MFCRQTCISNIYSHLDHRQFHPPTKIPGFGSKLQKRRAIGEKHCFKMCLLSLAIIVSCSMKQMTDIVHITITQVLMWFISVFESPYTFTALLLGSMLQSLMPFYVPIPKSNWLFELYCKDCFYRIVTRGEENFWATFWCEWPQTGKRKTDTQDWMRGGILPVKRWNRCNYLNKRASTSYYRWPFMYYSSICSAHQIWRIDCMFVCVCVCVCVCVWLLVGYGLESTVLLMDQLCFCLINLSEPTQGVLIQHKILTKR